MFSLPHFHYKFSYLPWLAICLWAWGFSGGISQSFANKVKSSVIIASVVGEVTSYNMIDDFKVTIDSKSVGRKMSAQSLLTTGKNGKIALLFSNGALFTIKPGSRFYLRKYKQLEGEVAGLVPPGKLEEEPTKSVLSAHLDFGELVVKAPKLNKGSSMKVTSPLGTAGIRGTMFQLMAVRNSVTGDISGGINLISGDIDFTDTNGNPVTLVSGQSIQVATNRLGETVASQSGELVNLTQTYGNALTLGFTPPPLQVLFPNLVNELGEPVADSASPVANASPAISTGGGGGFDFIQNIATEIFFEIESAEVSSSEFSFESMEMASGVEAPTPQTETPDVPAAIAGDPVVSEILKIFKGEHPIVRLLGETTMSIEMTDLPFSHFDPWITAQDFLGADISGSASLLNPPDLAVPGSYGLTYSVADIAGSTTTINRTVEVVVTPPSIALFPGKRGIDSDGAYLWQVKSRQAGYPLKDDGPFEIKRSQSAVNPYVTATFYNGESLAGEVDLTGSSVVDYSELGSEKTFSVIVSDISLRRVNFPDGSPVSSSIQPKVRIIDGLSPIVSVQSGQSANSVHSVSGKLNTEFEDPGITLLDNYFSQSEMEGHLGISQRVNGTFIIPDEYIFGSVNMEVAGFYEITYQGITDPSGNPGNSVTRFVQVTDDESPVVLINGATPLYVDLNQTMLDPDSFFDPGATASDNLLEGTTDWNSSTLEWRVTIQESVYGTDTWQSPFPDGTTMRGIIEEINDEQVAQSPLQYRITYSVRDKAGQVASAERIVILENSPYQEPQITVSISEPWESVGTDGGVPIAKGHVKALLSWEGLVDPHTVTELPGQGTLAGLVDAQIYYDSDDVRALGFSINQFLVDIDGEETEVSNTFDIEKVNYYDSGTTKYYVDPDGNLYPEGDAGWRKLVIRYTTETAMNKTDSTDLIVRIEDTTPPDFELLGDSSISIQAGSVYEDGDFDNNLTNISDNYDADISDNQKIPHLYFGGSPFSDPLGGDIFEVLKDPTIGFWKRGTYRVWYEIIDDFNNSSTSSAQERTVSVQDTTEPFISLIVHSDLTDGFSRISNRGVFSGPASPPNMFNALGGIDFANDGTSGSFVAQEDDSSFYLRLSDITNLNDVFQENYSVDTESLNIEADDPYGRTFTWYPALEFKDASNTVFFRDPGVYVENLSDAVVSVSSTISAQYDQPDDELEEDLQQLRSLTITYTASHNNEPNEQQTRVISFLDEEKPQIFLSPPTSKDGDFLIVEAGEAYDDSNEQSYDLTTNGNGSTISMRAFDIIDGDLSDQVIRTYYSGLHDNATISDATQVDGITTDEPNATFTIMYEVSDIVQDGDTEANHAEPQFRHVVVKDRIAPVISILSGGTDLVLDYLDPDSLLLDDVKDTMLVGLTAYDNNNIDDQLDTVENRNKWTVFINKDNENSSPDDFSVVGVYPEDRNDPGYNVWISVKDESGNESNFTISRTLKVGDYVPPTIYLIGPVEIHDFFRYESNSSFGSQKLYADQPQSADYNSSGVPAFAGGAHRLVLSNYTFVDPGAYAEDVNLTNPNDRGSFDADQYQYPDLNNNGIGETHAMVQVDTFSKLESCSEGYAKIHVYGRINNQTDTLAFFQNELSNDNNDTSFFSDGNFTTSEYAYDLNVSSPSPKVRRVKITLSYRVKDGWDNFSDIKTRTVYIYESEKVNGAFYATPVDVRKYALFDQNGSNNSDFFLTSVEKDSDGGGVSDFWEVSFGKNPFDASDDIDLDMSDPEIFKNRDFQGNWQKLPDVSVLSGIDNLTDFNFTAP